MARLAYAIEVSQFTLLANTRKGNKPDFHGAAGGSQAKSLYGRFVNQIQGGFEADRVKDGVFQAMMDVALVNDGPVSLMAYTARVAEVNAGYT